MKDIKVCYGIDVDCVAGWLGSYGGEDSPCDISRGVFAGRVGIPRLLDLFDRYGIKTTWFSCGHSIETFPEQMKDVVARGHEIGLHGYSHENPLAMTPEQEEKILLHTIDLVTELSGKKPVGYRAPWWEFSKVTNDLLVKHGIKYDSSLMHDEFHPYFVTTGDKWYPIRYDKDPDTWMKPILSKYRVAGILTIFRRRCLLSQVQTVSVGYHLMLSLNYGKISLISYMKKEKAYSRLQFILT